MRVSGERQRKRRNASPENFASAMNDGRPASSNTATAQGENCASSVPKLSSAIAFCTSPKLLMTSASGRVEASRRARVSLS